jgi:phytoene desaturase
MKTSTSQKAIVIGAGVAGLAAAIRLRNQGYQVLVLEANDFPGGKLSEIRLGNYRFDAGPSLFTMPHLVEELYWISGSKSDAFPYHKLDEVARYFFPDGTRFSVPAEAEERISVMAKALNESPEAIRQYLKKSRFLYETLGRLFLDRCLRRLSTWFNPTAFRAYLRLFSLGLFESLNSRNRKAFRHPNTVQLFNRYATYNGSDPYQTPAVMGMIPHLEFGIGAFFPKEGMHQITRSLTQLAEELGVEIRCSSPVEKLDVQGKTVTAAWTQGKREAADLVVSAIDVSQTYRRLLGQPKQGEKYAALPKSTSAIIWYWGIRRQDDRLGLHNLFFSSDYPAEFKALFQEKTLPADPTIYLNISSKENPADAPEGCENWFVMVNAPANEGQPWDQWVAETRKTVVNRLRKELGWDPEEFLEAETHLDPRSLESRTGALGGALYGSNSNHPFAAFFRHANYHRAYENLYFCGGTVHPGGGIPLALKSAELALSYVPGLG